MVDFPPTHYPSGRKIPERIRKKMLREYKKIKKTKRMGKKKKKGGK